MSTIETIDELPWGPGYTKLLKQMEILVEVDSYGDTQVWSDALGFDGKGADYVEALIDFAGNIESVVDSLKQVSPSLRKGRAAETLDALAQYIPIDDE